MWVVTSLTSKKIKGSQISIHTTRVGGDGLTGKVYVEYNFISIHTTRVGGDLEVIVLKFYL